MVGGENRAGAQQNGREAHRQFAIAQHGGGETNQPGNDRRMIEIPAGKMA